MPKSEMIIFYVKNNMLSKIKTMLVNSKKYVIE